MSPGVLADTGYDQVMIRSWKMAGGKNAVRSKETRQII